MLTTPSDPRPLRQAGKQTHGLPEHRTWHIYKLKKKIDGDRCVSYELGNQLDIQVLCFEFEEDGDLFSMKGEAELRLNWSVARNLYRAIIIV